MTEKPNTGEGEGVRAERAFLRRIWAVGGGVTVVAAVVAVGLGSVAHKPTPAGTVFPPAAALAAAIVLPLLMLTSAWFVFRLKDEFIRERCFRAFTAAFYACVIGFMAWGMLWRGGLAPVPNAGLLIAGSAMVIPLASVWFKLRR